MSRGIVVITHAPVVLSWSLVRNSYSPTAVTSSSRASSTFKNFISRDGLRIRTQASLLEPALIADIFAEIVHPGALSQTPMLR